MTQHGQSFVALSEISPLLVVFLRHAGCTFCREALSDIARSRALIERQGTRILLVHMGDGRSLDALLQKHKLDDLDLISDPDQTLYRAFGLKRGNVWQLFGSKVLWRAFGAGVLLRYGIGPVVADSAQMPGVFYLEQSVIVRRFRHQSAADRPDYACLSGCR